MKQHPLAPIPLLTAILLAVAALFFLLSLFLGIGYYPAAVVFSNLLGFGVYGFFSVILFFRRRDILLPVAAGAMCLLNVVVLLRSFASIWSFLGSLLYLGAAVCILTWAAAASLDSLAEHRPITEKLWFLPGLTAALGGFLTVAAGSSVMTLFGNLLLIAIYFLLSLTIVFQDGIPGHSYDRVPFDDSHSEAEDTQAYEYAPSAEEDDRTYPPVFMDGFCSMLKHVLLLVFTFGIWELIWIYRTTGYLNQTEDEPLRTPTYQLLLCLFVPFYFLYWRYQSAKRLDRLANSRGVECDLRVLSLIISFFVPILPPILMQERMNTLSRLTDDRYRSMFTYDIPSDEDLADRLRLYKNLLDDGLITQDDYDAKKKQILRI